MAGRLYAFDLDDNIITTDAHIRTSQGRVSTREFAEVRHRVSLPEDAFVELADIDRCTFIPALSFSAFQKALRESSPIAIITARSNPMSDLQRLLVRINGGLRLHEHIHIYCCNSTEFMEQFNVVGVPLEQRKCIALEHFISLYPLANTLGFSDDDPLTISRVGSFLSSIHSSYPGLSCSIYDTSGSNIDKTILCS